MTQQGRVVNGCPLFSMLGLAPVSWEYGWERHSAAVALGAPHIEASHSLLCHCWVGGCKGGIRLIWPHVNPYLFTLYSPWHRAGTQETFENEWDKKVWLALLSPSPPSRPPRPWPGLGFSLPLGLTHSPTRLFASQGPPFSSLLDRIS